MEPVEELATVIDPCVKNGPDYAGMVEIKTEGTLNREFSPRELLEPLEDSAEPTLIEAAEVLLASTFAAPYRLISPFKELADALARAKAGER